VDTDAELDSPSNNMIPSQKAVKEYVDKYKVAYDDYTANSILYTQNSAGTSATTYALTVGTSNIVGRKDTGNIVSLTKAEANVILNTVTKDDFGANSILYATTAGSPVSGGIDTNSVLGRINSNIKSLSQTELTSLINYASPAETRDGLLNTKFVTPLSLMGKVDPDLSLAANSDNLVASQAATKAYADTKIPNSLVDTYTIIYGSGVDTPSALLVNTSNFVGRKSSGNIASLTSTEANEILGNNTSNVLDGATMAVNWDTANVQVITLGAVGGGTGKTITFSNGREGRVYKLILIQDGSGGRTVTTWNPSIKWASGTAPTLTTTAGKADIITMLYAGGSYYADCTKNF
jgi:hypothetical protein